MDKDYWIKYWKQDRILHSRDAQKQVGRTINKVPIDDAKWDYTLRQIEKILEIHPDDIVLDLCAGNGLISRPFSKKCKSVTAADVSPILSENISNRGYPNIEVIIGDVRSLQFPVNSFTKVVMYFALQFFTERETIRLFESVHNWLTPGGIFLIGDIPDADKVWLYFNTPEREKAYFDSLRNETPIIGSWFKRDFLIKLGRHAGFTVCRALDQDPRLINAHYRFDLKLVK